MTQTQRDHQRGRELVDSDGVPDGTVSEKVDRLNTLAWELCDSDSKRAYALSETAFHLAHGVDTGTEPYQIGVAYSLRTQGYLHMRSGDYPRGMAQLFEAQALFETLQTQAERTVDDGLIDVLDGIAGIYIQMGNLPEGLDYSYRMLQIAQPIGDTRRIANAYNNLSNIYFETGDYERSREVLQQNVLRAAEINDRRIETLSYVNLADLHFSLGDYGAALENALHALDVSRAAGFEQFEIYALDYIGKTKLKLGSQSEAIDALEHALAASRRIGSHVTEAVNLLTLGQVYREMDQPERALAYLQQSVRVAESIDGKNELFRAYMLLSELHEQGGDAAQALVHFKRYHTLKELVAGEKANQRLKVLQVAHDTETARREAQALQLQTVSLERQVEARTAELRQMVDLLHNEVGERERAEATLQHILVSLEHHLADRTEALAAFFDLSVLAGRATHLNDAFVQVLPRMIEVIHSQAICLHLLDADHTVLHLVAQQNLSHEFQASVQTVALAPDLQRWLHEPGEPLVTTDLATLTTLPSVFRFPAFHIYMGAQIRVGSQVTGIISCYRAIDRGFSLDEIALVIALAEQLGVMLEIHELRETTEAIAVLEERQRLARNLHDSVSQSLYSLSLFSRAGSEAAADGDSERLKHSLHSLERTTLHALREMRLLLYELRPADLEHEGLLQAIELRLNMVERRANLQLDVQLDELPGLLHHQEIELYYIIVEAMNNVIKHAAASRLTVHLTAANQELHLQIGDDGRGFDPQHSAGGMGLRNMRERVDRLGGQLALFSTLGGGTRLEIVLPYDKEINP